MCEYTEDCSLSDDPLAMDLWQQVKSGRLEPERTVECDRHHLLAVVVLHADRGRLLVTPHIKIAKAMVPGLVKPTIFLHWPQGGAGHDGYTHQHAGAIPEADWKHDAITYLRCRCGTWTITDGTMIDSLAEE